MTNNGKLPTGEAAYIMKCRGAQFLSLTFSKRDNNISCTKGLTLAARKSNS